MSFLELMRKLVCEGRQAGELPAANVPREPQQWGPHSRPMGSGFVNKALGVG